MKNHTRFVLLASMTLCLVLGAVAELNGNADKITLKFELGETIRYKTVIETTIDMMGESTEVNSTTVSQTVVLSASKGWTKLRISNESFEISGEIQQDVEEMVEAMKGLVVTLEVNDRGLARNIALENTDAIDPMMLDILSGSIRVVNFIGFMGVHFPEKPIDVGSEWNVKLKGKDMFGESGVFNSVDGDLPVSFKVLGFEDINGIRHVRIESIMEGDLEMGIASPVGDVSASMSLESTSVIWVDVETGHVTRSTGESTISTDFGLGSMEQEIKTSIQRLD